MITLKTGLPRNGKTLSLVDEVATLLERWAKHPGERRPVYQFGIDELVLDGVERLEVWPVGGKLGDPIPRRADGKVACKLTFDQGALPDGALVLLDESQDFYPPRGPSQAAPAHVAELNTHGHRNLDYIVLTQHPKLIDNAVRRLVNKHQHYRRMFGGGRAITYEWDVCSDSLDFPKAIKGVFSYPRKRFGLYKSATGFTRPKFKLPAFLIVPALALPLGIFAGPQAFHALYGASTGKGIGSTAAPASSPARPASSAYQREATRPNSPEGAASAPVVFAGCIAMGARCSCIGDKGLLVKVDVEVCQTNVASSGHAIPYQLTPSPGGGGFNAATGLPVRAPAASQSVSGGAVTIQGTPPDGTQRHVAKMSKSFL